MGGSSNRKRLWEILGVLRRHNITSGISPEKLPPLLSELGPTFVKLGQLLSMQPTILPAAYCAELKKLQTAVTPMAFGEVRAVLEAEYGAGPDEIFSEVGADPLGSASIAQVHPARLRGGEEVVVKVQRPGIFETMSRDIALLKKAAGLLRFAAPIGEIDLYMVIDEMWAAAEQEMDFTAEAENLREFRRNNAGVAFVSCPEIFDGYSTARVLVMERVEGPFIDDAERLRESGYDLNEIAMKLARNYLRQVFEDGFFHADPHCGNIIIRDGKIVWLDLGMTGRLSPRDRKLLSRAAFAAAEGDVAALTDLALLIGTYREQVDYAALRGDIEAMLAKYGAADFGGMDLMALSDDFLSILKRHRIGIPRGITLLLKGMATLQGTLRALAPDINFTEIMAGYMSESGFKDLDVENELRDTLRSLRKSLDIPAQISDLLKLFSKGGSKAGLDVSLSERTGAKVERLVNRLVLSIVTCGLLIGSGILCTADIQPKIFGVPLLGALGFFAAAVLGGWIVISMLKKS